MKEIEVVERPEVDNRRERTMLLGVVLLVDRILLSVGKTLDDMIDFLIVVGLHFGLNIVKNGHFEIICEPSPASCLKMLCYGGFVALLLYNFMSEHKSLIAQRLYGGAILFSFVHHCWTIISVLRVAYQFCFLLCIICLALSYLVVEVKDTKLKIRWMNLCLGMWLVLMSFAIIWEPTGQANYFKALHPSLIALPLNIVAALFLNGYCLRVILPNMLSHMIGFLYMMVCSVGKNSELMNAYLKLFEIKLGWEAKKIYDMLQERRGPADQHKIIWWFGGLAVFLCCLGMLNHTPIHHPFRGVVFLLSFGHFLWSFSTPLPFWSRVRLVCVLVFSVAGSATIFEYYIKPFLDGWKT